VDNTLLAKLKPHHGKRVVLAVSPAGSVRLTRDDGKWDEIFGEEQSGDDAVIRPDLNKLDLEQRDFLPLSRLRASDSGRSVGPKAAKLGELKHHYPEAVAEGLAIPFGVFRELLDQPMPGEGKSVFDWMVEQYAQLRTLPAGSEQHKQATDRFRQRLQNWIRKADPGDEFRRKLKSAMEKVFGRDGSYGVFVRSDTNVEDLPGFTGAGLNLTVANAVGYENILTAISRVWASPFSARAYAWRQSHMEKPQHVYPAVLLLRSVPADKSGVLVTQDIDSGDRSWLSVAVNEGVGGAVDGQAAESLRINTENGVVRLMAQATAPIRRKPLPSGGISKLPVSGSETVLQPAEIKQLIQLSRELPQRFPAVVDDQGRPVPADVEFGFLDGKLKLFQIRPFLESKRARGSAFLNSMDEGLKASQETRVALNRVPDKE
jgi:phosphoenolpyruvate synthase/pyruvate phosphate dikinase